MKDNIALFLEAHLNSCFLNKFTIPENMSLNTHTEELKSHSLSSALALASLFLGLPFPHKGRTSVL